MQNYSSATACHCPSARQCQSQTWTKEEGDANDLCYHTVSLSETTSTNINIKHKQNGGLCKQPNFLIYYYNLWKKLLQTIW